MAEEEKKGGCPGNCHQGGNCGQDGCDGTQKKDGSAGRCGGGGCPGGGCPGQKGGRDPHGN